MTNYLNFLEDILADLTHTLDSRSWNIYMICQ